MNRSLQKIVLVAPLALLLCSLNAHASSQVGQAVVKVADKDGNPVAEATVELSGQYLIGGVRTATTDANGSARFTQLTPAPDYQIVVRHANFRVVKTTGIEVKLGGTITVPVEMLPMAADEDVEEIVVTGEVPTIDTEKLKLGIDITADFVEQLPTSRDYQGMVVFVPGVEDSDGDGNSNFMGSVDQGNQYLLDGMNVTDPVTNTFSANFNFDAIQSVEVITGGRDAEYGSAIGGVMNVVTKGGSNEFDLDASVYFQPDTFQLKHKGEERESRTLDLNLAVGGPIIKDKLWYYVSLNAPMTWSSRPEPDGGSIFPDQRGKKRPTRRFLGFFPMGKLTYQLTEDTIIKVLAQADPAWIDNTRQGSTVHPDAERTQIQKGFVTAVYAETFLTEDLFWDNRVGLKMGGLDIKPVSGDLDTPGHYNLATGAATVNDTQWYEDTRTRIQLHSALTWTLDDFFGEHQIKAGVDVSLTWHDEFQSLPGGESYDDNGLDPSDPNSVSGVGLPGEKTVMIEAQDTSIFGDTEAVYVQDVWKPIDTLTIRPGVRFDSARMRNWEDEVQVNINTISPRLGVAWDPFDDGRTQLRAGYYMYVDTGFLSLSGFAGGRSPLQRTFEYNPITGEYDIFVTESGGPSGVVGKDYLKDAWNQRRPRTHEAIAGFSRELVPDLNMSVDYTFRYNQNQWEDDEINVLWNDGGDNAIGFINGESKFIYSLGAMRDSWLRYHSVQVKLDKRFSRNWQMLASYTWSHTEGTQGDYIISVAFDRPRMRDYEFGYAPWDVRHNLKVSGSYKLPYGIVLGGRFEYSTGLPYNRYYLNNFYNDYEDRFSPRGVDICPDGADVCEDEDRQDLRLADIAIFNARIMWQLEELLGHKIDLIADVFNFLHLNTATAVEERNLPSGGDQGFGDVVSRRRGLTAQVGLRYRY